MMPPARRKQEPIGAHARCLFHLDTGPELRLFRDLHVKDFYMRKTPCLYLKFGKSQIETGFFIKSLADFQISNRLFLL